MNDAWVDATAASDWTRGGERVVFQHCGACGHTWYFRRDFCPACGHASPESSVSGGAGTVHASTLVHRAPTDDFRAAAPYRIVLVDLAEGFRMMGHADLSLAIGEPVQCRIRTIAGRLLPYFDRIP